MRDSDDFVHGAVRRGVQTGSYDVSPDRSESKPPVSSVWKRLMRVGLRLRAAGQHWSAFRTDKEFAAIRELDGSAVGGVGSILGAKARNDDLAPHDEVGHPQAAPYERIWRPK